MKKKSLLTTLALGAAAALCAAEPIQVSFTLLTNPTLEGEEFPLYITYGQELWGDYNNDGKLDRFIIGGNGGGHLSLYKNEGSLFTKIDTPVTPLAGASALFIDYDNDGNLDLLILGKGEENTTINELWRNTGEEGEYAFEKDETFPGFGICDHEYQSRCNFLSAIDYDNDGWTDFVAMGHTDGDWYTKLYRNNRGYFEEDEHPVNDNRGRGAFRQIVKGSVAAADLNNDGYADIILSGEDAAEGYKTVTTVYFNNGDNTFREIADPTVFAGQNRGTTFAADVNNDGYPDIVEMGDNHDSGRDTGDGRKRVGNIYINNTDETFTPALPAETSGLLEMRAMPSVGDINNDGLTDILVTDGWEGDFTHLFYSKGDGTFADYRLEEEISGREGVVSFVDFDGDGALDISLEGWCNDWHNVLLLNDWATGPTFPQAPSVPTGLTVVQDGDDVVLSWNASTDDTTLAAAIRYNIFIQAKEPESDGYLYTYTYAPADLETGFLKFTGKPHFIGGTTITLKGIKAEDFNFGVQAVDNGWMASAFAKVAGGTGIGTTTGEETLEIYVSDGKIVVKTADNAPYSLYTINGMAIANDAKLVAGTYLVKVSSAKGKIVRKVVM